MKRKKKIKNVLGKDYKWLKKEVNKFKIEPEDALIVTINGKNEIFCQGKNKKNKEFLKISLNFSVECKSQLYIMSFVTSLFFFLDFFSDC